MSCFSVTVCPGSWRSSRGWCFGRLAAGLRRAGHEVQAPSLSGLADRKHLLSPAINLDTHITDVANLLEYEEMTGVVLVGHSYGGMAITGVADRIPDRVRRLVYLDAAHPKNRESMLDYVTSGLADILSREVRTVDGVDLVVLPDSPLLNMMGLTDLDDIRWLRSKATPHPWNCFTQRLVLNDEQAVGRIRRTSINCTATLSALSEHLLPRQTTGADLLLEIDTGHDLMVTEPEAVAAMLIRSLRQRHRRRRWRGHPRHTDRSPSRSLLED